MRDFARQVLGVWALVATAFVLMGVTIPHTFSAGDVISASEMNENFAALKQAVDTLEGSVETLGRDLASAQAEIASLRADVNMLRSPLRIGSPLAFALIGADGTIAAQWTSTGNPLSVDKPLGTTGVYNITLPDRIAFEVDGHAVTLTPTDDGRQPIIMQDRGNLSVLHHDADGAPVDSTFQVLIFNDATIGGGRGR